MAHEPEPKQATPAEIASLNAKLDEFKTLSVVADRMRLSSDLGKQYDGDRDLYDSLGWTKEPDFATYNNHYKRNSIAKSVINAPVDATFAGDITIQLGDGTAEEQDHPFLTKWDELYKGLNLKDYFVRVDKLAGIFQFAVLRLGFKDGQDSMQPVSNGVELIYVSPYSQCNADVKSEVNDQEDPRYGQPQMYTLTPTTQNTANGSKDVHWSRIIHVAEGLLEDEVFGTPRLEAVLNNLDNLNKIVGGSAEMYWRGAFPGYGFKIDPEAQMMDEDTVNMATEIDNMLLGLKRYIKLQGVDIQQLEPQVADPRGHVEVQVDMISGTSRIPKRILIGSERGELASTQDRDNWHDVIQSRRENYAEPMIVRALIDRLIEYKVLPFVDSYTVEWPDLAEQSASEAADIAVKKMEALNKYVTGLGADEVFPIEIFLAEIMGASDDMITRIMEIRDQMAEVEAQELAEEQEEFERQQREEQAVQIQPSQPRRGIA